MTGQTAIISGGLGDIGRAIARRLAELGADIALGDLYPAEEAQAFLATLQLTGRRTRYDQADVADAEAVAGWVAAVEDDLGVPCLVVPNAAIVTLKGIRSVSAAEWRKEIDTNLNGAFYLAQSCALRMLAKGQQGRIVFVGSWAAHAVHTGLPAYCVAKAGLRMLCRCMAADLAGNGILVNEIAPGYVDAGLSGRIFEERPHVRATASQQVPVGALISAEEVAEQVAYLCGPSGKHITGTTLLMDGGLSLVSPGSQRGE